MSFKEIMDTAVELPLDLKLKLLDKISESINFPLDPDIEASWDEEIDKRIHEIDSGKVECISYEDIKDRIYKKFNL